MRRRTLLAAAATVPVAATAGCLETIDVQMNGVVLSKEVWGRIHGDQSDLEGPVATWLLEDGELVADVSDDAPLPTERPVALDDDAVAYLEENHAPYTLTINICESPGESDGGCSGPTIDRETFDRARLGERAMFYQV